MTSLAYVCRVVPALGLVACLGLAGVTENRIRTRASYDLHCSSDDVSVEQVTAGTYSATGCGRSARYVCEHETCVLNGREMGAAAAPVAAAPAPTAKPSGPTKIADHGVVFELAAGFDRDDEAKFEVYRDSGHHHAVRLTIESSTDAPDTYLTAKHAGAKVWSADVDGSAISYAKWTGTKLRFASAALARSGKVYELSCSSDDLESEKTDAVCASVLKSFRFAPGGLPGE